MDKYNYSKHKPHNEHAIIFIVVQTPNGGGNRFYDHTILSNLLYSIRFKKKYIRFSPFIRVNCLGKL